jgi:hypothetical protein
MCEGRDEKGDSGRDWTRHVILRCRVDMATEEVMDRLVPVGKPVSMFPESCRIKVKQG